jgi:AraC family transcriptional regulator
MSYQRNLIFHTPLLTWQHVTLDAEYNVWSPQYHVETPRLLMPLTLCFDCQFSAASFTCDPLTALWLTPEQGYRMRRPWRKQSSALLTVNAAFGNARRLAVPLAAHVKLRQWRREWASGQLQTLQLEERLATLLQALNVEGNKPYPPQHRAVERAREYIAYAPDRNDTLSEIATAAHCSPFHLARAFRQRTRYSLHSYRTQLRMAKAIDKLDEGEMNLNVLAAELGYASHSHFSSVFKRTFNITPSQMRTNLIATH